MAVPRKVRLGLTLVVLLGVVAGAVAVIASLTHSAPQAILSRCTAGGEEVTTDQASVAAQMVGEVYQLKIAHPDRAAVLALAGAYQESKWANIPAGEGDRDSVGVLQQRPSQDWGKFDGEPTAEAAKIAARTKRISDVTEATREFLVKLSEIDSWWTLPAADAIQKVQTSADGSLYAQHEPLATAYTKALLGREAAGLTCTFEAPTQIAATSTVVTDLKHQLGLTTPTSTAQAVRVPGAGWQTASWFVANADRYGIASVEFSSKTWTRTGGWKASSASSGSVLATMDVAKKK